MQEKFNFRGILNLEAQAGSDHTLKTGSRKRIRLNHLDPQPNPAW